MAMDEYTVVLDANRRDGTIAAIHRKGCRAAKRDQVPGSTSRAVTGTLNDALNVAVDDEDRRLGYNDTDAKLHNCVKG